MPGLTGKIDVVTGANTGLGLGTCRQLALHGAKVYLAARSEEKGAKAVEVIRKEAGNENVKLLILNLADVKEVREARRDRMLYSWLALHPD